MARGKRFVPQRFVPREREVFVDSPSDVVKKAGLNKLSDQDLRDELARRDEIRRAAAETKARERNEQLVKLILSDGRPLTQAISVAGIPKLLDLLLGEHGATTCSDVSPNTNGRCTRCTLLYAFCVEGYLDPNLQIKISLERVEF